MMQFENLKMKKNDVNYEKATKYKSKLLSTANKGDF